MKASKVRDRQTVGHWKWAAVFVALAAFAAVLGPTNPSAAQPPVPEAEPDRPDFEPPPLDGAEDLPPSGSLQIIQGREVNEGEFPFLVRITVTYESEAQFLCSGVLIDADRVLTAAHCLAEDEEHGDAIRTELRLGIVDVFDTSGQTIDQRVADRVWLHPNYGQVDHEFLSGVYDDIAIIQLKTPADLSNPNIAPIPYGSMDRRFQTFAIGWGDIEPAEDVTVLPSVARVGTLGFFDCIWSPFWPVVNNFRNLCSSTHHDATCGGDSGGPAVQTIDGTLTLVGLTSFGGRECGEYPSYFQRVDQHAFWLAGDPSVLPPKCFDHWVTIDMNANGGDGTGTESYDVILGTPGADTIVGHGESDLICSGDGDDRVFGRQGADAIDGGPGNDVIHGNMGDDYLAGGLGNDKIFGYAGNDTVLGEGGNDRLHGNFGEDYMVGGPGNDAMFGYGDNDRMLGGMGDDLMVGNRDDDHLSGGPGNDTIYGSHNDDLLEGNAGNDVLHGNSSDDELRGGEGADSLNGGIGTDVCWGGSERDRASRCETIFEVP